MMTKTIQTNMHTLQLHSNTHLSMAAIVSTASRQPNMAPNRIILPTRTSTGSVDRWKPSAVNSSVSEAEAADAEAEEDDNEDAEEAEAEADEAEDESLPAWRLTMRSACRRTSARTAARTANGFGGCGIRMCAEAETIHRRVKIQG